MGAPSVLLLGRGSCEHDPRVQPLRASDTTKGKLIKVQEISDTIFRKETGPLIFINAGMSVDGCSDPTIVSQAYF